MNHYFQTLELHKVLERLAEETSNSCTRQMALEIEPSADPARVQQLLGMTEDALQLSIQYGTPPFYQRPIAPGKIRLPYLFTGTVERCTAVEPDPEPG